MCPAMIRAKIPLWYTEGFNPHPKMVFAQPLPLFVMSECELLDIKITEDIGCDEICKRLRGAFTDELYVEEVYYPQRKFAEIAYAEYRITNSDNIDQPKLDAIMSGDIIVLKKTKSGEKEINIRPQIREVKLLGDGVITAVLSASGEAYLNPDIFCRAFDSALGSGDADHEITRIGWYDKDMKPFI